MSSPELTPTGHTSPESGQPQELSRLQWEAQTALPLVSVVILNYNRRDALAQALDSVLRQDYPNREIIVVDNHSEEDIRSVVEARGSGIKLIELPRNLGSCAGRNAGIREARGEFIITIDNDVNLASPFEISKVVKAFQERPHSHVLVFQICDADTGKLRLREWCHPKYWKEFGNSEFETYYLPEGACAFRRQVFEVVGLYYEPFFIYHEGGDLSLRLLDRGFRVLYFPQVRVHHLMSPEARTQGRSLYFHTRNWIWFAYKDFHFYRGLRFLMPRLAMMFYFAMRTRSLRAFAEAVWDGVVGLKRIRPERTPISAATVKYVADLDKGRPNWRLRLARHRSQPQL